MIRNSQLFAPFIFLFFLLSSTVGCASRPSVVVNSDFPLSQEGYKNSASKFNSAEMVKTILQNDSGGEITNASGITFVPREKKYYVVTNNNNEMHVFDNFDSPESRAIQTIKLSGWTESGVKFDQDLEDLVYLGENDKGEFEIALTNEGTPEAGAEVYICAMKSTQSSLLRKDCQRIHVNVPISKVNKGIEGISYDPDQKMFYVVVEGNEKGKHLSVNRFKRPELSSFSKDETGTQGLSTVTAEPLFDAEKLIAQLCPDLSGILFSPQNQHLYLLSHIGEKVIDVDLNGTVYGQFPLEPGLQFEGLSFDENQKLIFVSEPNLLYRVQRNP